MLYHTSDQIWGLYYLCYTFYSIICKNIKIGLSKRCIYHVITVILYFLHTGSDQTELFQSMTKSAKEVCILAQHTLQVHYYQVSAGAVALCDMRFLKRNEKIFEQLCTAARIRGFRFKIWLGRLEDVERHIEKVQQFRNLLDRNLQGMWYNIKF